MREGLEGGRSESQPGRGALGGAGRGGSTKEPPVRERRGSGREGRGRCWG